jgi:hypothetical protein
MKNLKQFILLFTLFTFIGFNSVGQVIKRSDARKNLKSASKEAKGYEKEGYYVIPGSLPMVKQLEKSYARAMEEDENGYPKYIVTAAVVVAETQATAKIAAEEVAKLSIAGTMQSTIAAIIETQLANQQFNTQEAASLQKTVAASKNIIAQKLGRLIVLTEFYNDMGKKSKSIEITLRVGYSEEMARKVALDVIKEELGEEADALSDQLDSLLDLDTDN